MKITSENDQLDLSPTPDDNSNESVINKQEEIIQSFKTSIPLTIHIWDGCFVAGIRAKDKIGGPELSITGYTNYQDTLNANGTIKYQNQIYRKVFCNKAKLSDFDLFGGNHNSKYYFHFFENQWDQWKDRKDCKDNLWIVCKYWDETEKKFLYILKEFFEVKSI